MAPPAPPLRLPPGAQRDPGPAGPAPEVAVDSSTWRWVLKWAESKRLEAEGALSTPSTTDGEVHFHRGVLACVRELRDKGETRARMQR